ncbi:hypothetical protein RI049_07770 [Cedecea neteri]|uniref:hypothetical protein n=1 Tax=Cedecea neteri TaxID=158822 RepID=UPI0005D7C979|nr:hypothetical protein [Cedecea neteri]AJZ90203.1 hypothetical protein VW41_14850 [Klebsiella michiganensis]WPU24632.1 hypothetical protein RI049_07770 [Cedecea neteri]
MEKYVFYSKDISVNIYPKASLTSEEKQRLSKEGYQRIGFETRATDEADAMERYLTHFKENTEALEDYAKDIAFSSLLFNGGRFLF